VQPRSVQAPPRPTVRPSRRSEPKTAPRSSVARPKPVVARPIEKPSTVEKPKPRPGVTIVTAGQPIADAGESGGSSQGSRALLWLAFGLGLLLATALIRRELALGRAFRPMGISSRGAAVLKRLAATVLVIVTAAVAAFAILAFGGFMTVEPEAVSAPVSTLPRALAAGPSPRPIAETARAERAPARSGAKATITITATRGDTSISARRASAEGTLLYEAILPKGQAARFSTRRLWVRFGAAANVDIQVNGKPVARLPSGTVDVVLPRVVPVASSSR
jgi:Domain of unknown function (DUF4115)